MDKKKRGFRGSVPLLIVEVCVLFIASGGQPLEISHPDGMVYLTHVVSTIDFDSVLFCADRVTGRFVIAKNKIASENRYKRC